MKKFAIAGILICMLFIFIQDMTFAAEAPGGAPAAAAGTVTQDALDALKSSMQVGIDTAWVLFTAFLVFFMNDTKIYFYYLFYYNFYYNYTSSASNG